MEQVLDEPEVSVDVVSAMRHLAQQGASVWQLAECVQSRRGLKPDALLQLLWYFMKAFHLSLADGLPIREWLGTANDKEIDALMLPAIQRTRGEWSA